MACPTGTYSPAGSAGCTDCAGAQPVILIGPASSSYEVGAVITLSVTAGAPAGADAFTYYWRKDGVTLMTAPNIPSVTEATLIINPATAADAGAYDVVVINVCGWKTSDAAAVSVADCRADFDDDGFITADDIFAFLDEWFSNPGPGMVCPPLGPCRADWNDDGQITADDIFSFLSSWFEAVPGSACP